MATRYRRGGGGSVAVLLVAWSKASVGALVIRGGGLQSSSGIFRQTMDNFVDLQYYGNITVGGQILHAVLDTGSIEFVILSDKCKRRCGNASSLYHSRRSPTYSAGNNVTTLYYGSGGLAASLAYESVDVGPISATATPFWEVSNANMPLLLESNFQAIVGLGPYPVAPFAVDDPSAMLLRKFDVDRFGLCLGRQPGSPGFFIWNDDSVDQATHHFRTLSVSPTGYWMVSITDVTIGSTAIGCALGCGAVLDSGTSLLALPDFSFDEVESAVQALHVDCENLTQLPDIRFKLNGYLFSLSADAYIGYITGEVSEGYGAMLHVRNRAARKQGNSSQCEVALMNVEMESRLGPVWILGAPFFRKYYTIFAQGRHPSIHVTPASEDCKPVSASQARKGMLAGVGPSQMSPRKIDAGSLRMPPWALKVDGRRNYSGSGARIEPGLWKSRPAASKETEEA